MSKASHVRVVSLVLALSVVTGGWFLLEYSQRVPQHAQLIERQPKTIPLPQERAESPPPKAPSPKSLKQSKNLVVTFKCEQDGRVSYSDQPCANGARILAVTAEKDVQPPNPTTNLQRMKARAAAMEADRLARERQFEIATAETAIATASSANSKARECESIDNAIASVDARLRQAHSAREGDDWTAERRKLTDRQFSLGC